MAVPLIDTHCHINHSDFSSDLPDILFRARSSGVERLLCVGWDLPSSSRAVEQARALPSVRAAVGVHPHDADRFDPETEAALLALAADRAHVVAVGETGLDYFRSKTPRHVQQEAFRRQIRLAARLELPLIVHNRDAGEDVVSILREEGLPPRGVVMHCFSGDTAFAETVLGLGCFLGLAGQITFKNGEQAREVARSAPLERLFLETDAPYLAPAPHRGRRNEPAYLALTAAKLAEVRGISPQEAAERTTENALKFFALE